MFSVKVMRYFLYNVFLMGMEFIIVIIGMMLVFIVVNFVNKEGDLNFVLCRNVIVKG